MLKATELNINNIRKELEIISQELLVLIKKYELTATSQLDVIEMAREKIGDKNDYIRFLELSLEGRIYGEAATAIENAASKNTRNLH